MKTVIDTAVSNPDFSTLVTAIKAAGLVDTLSGTGPFTVLAPTNAAFAELPQATLDGILADKEKLMAILTYHVVAGKIMLQDLLRLSEAKTLQGSEVEIDAHNDVMVTDVETPDMSEISIDAIGHILINGATVTKTDIECTNGVIHAIDTVLLPK